MTTHIQGHRIDLEIREGVARLTNSTPDGRNAIDLGWCHSFSSMARRCASDTSVRVVVLQSRGEFFSVGGDIDDFIAHRALMPGHANEMANHLHSGIQLLVRGRAPVIAAVRGVAAGGGMSLALSADMVIASRAARFITAYTRSGLSPDGGLSWVLPRIVGPKRAFDLLALNDPVTADEALSLGMVSRVCDEAEFDATLESIIARLCAMSPVALAGLKRLMASSPGSTLAQQFDNEAETIGEVLTRPETNALLDAFVARRKQGHPKS